MTPRLVISERTSAALPHAGVADQSAEVEEGESGCDEDGGQRGLRQVGQ